ncbi:DUF2490 domain-containing protein [Deminuibacter soli]|uniref:DUF2490 domain-containing protein n=2 Tax=Deminuibacter soli TaxID=2291815 RepID=A0A3E1NRN8_9BACT|nr:DUF2490 domain-containing protein [Deminuibacter soli]
MATLLPYAQTRVSDHNDIGWFTTTITPRITSKLSGHIEYQWRRDNIVTDWQQSLLRIGLNYKIHPQVTLHAGYGWIVTFPYSEHQLSAVPRSFGERRIYEQVVVNSTVGKASLSHRFRLEQRWLAKYNSLEAHQPDTYTYLNRIRYMPRLDVPLNKHLFAALYDELFIGFGKNLGENVFDQNRLGILMGYKFNNNIRIEAGFLNQIVQLSREIDGKNAFQYNSGVIVNTHFNLF